MATLVALAFAASGSSWIAYAIWAYRWLEASLHVAGGLALVALGGAIARRNGFWRIRRTSRAPKFLRFAKPRRAKRIALIVGILLALTSLDWWQQNHELDNLLGEAAKFEASTVGAAKKWDSKCDYYPGRLCRAFAYGASVTAQTQAADVAHVNALPWHGDIKEAQRAYVDHIDAWTDLWDDRAAGRYGGPYTAIGGSFNISGNRFEDAVPPYPIFDQRQRIARIWGD